MSTFYDLMLTVGTGGGTPYVPPEYGTLTVTISGGGNAGRWSVDGGATWKSGGETITLRTGTYTVTYKDVYAYFTPENHTVLISSGAVETTEASYVNMTPVWQTAGVFASAWDGITASGMNLYGEYYDQTVFVFNGGTGSSLTARCIYIYSGGLVSTAYYCDELTIYSGGVASNASATRANISGGTLCDTYLWTGCQTYVSSGGVASNTTVTSGGFICITIGGTANGTTLSSYSDMIISSGGTANETVVSGIGRMYIENGVANSTTVENAGQLRVSSGGTASMTTVSSGGTMYVSSGGTALNVTSRSGATVSVYQGGTITYA